MNKLRECDIVMKGGITSGVVYPMAVSELSKVYRFRNIGGTSAGAIAATLTAAAEYRRQRTKGTAHENAGFDALSELPGWLQENSHLRSLFQPRRDTKALFTFLMSLLPKGVASHPPRNARPAWFHHLKAVSRIKRVLGTIWSVLVAIGRVLMAMFRTVYCITSFLSALSSIGLMVFAIHYTSDVGARVFAIVAAALLGVALFVVLPLVWVIWDLLRAVPKNNYGLCSGMPDEPSKSAPLTQWLSDKIDGIAGKAGNKPLTFGDLWNTGMRGRKKPRSTAKGAPAPRDINIEMVTTNVTYGRPFTLPFEQDINRFYFHPTELEALFPARIVEWLKAHPRPPSDRNSPARRAALAKRGLLPFPLPKDIPIVVAARMSLSFPVLLSAIPLYGIDWNMRYNQMHPKAPYTHRCWFSDGGLSSNFPLQFFDAPIPSRPTFGINLRAFDSARQESEANEADNVWMQRTNDDIIWDNRNGFDDKGPSLPGFLTAIVDTMQNWNDNLQAQVPGFRDRIVHVFLSSSEGGLNLDMPKAVLTKLTKRGQCAGQLLIQRYASPSAPTRPQAVNWANHRWVRLRVATSAIQRFVVDFAVKYNAAPTFGDLSYSRLVSRDRRTPPLSYELKRPGQTRFAIAQTSALAKMGANWYKAPPADFVTGSPKPMPELQTRPRI